MREGREGRTKKNKNLKALYGILPTNGNETCMTALHYATRKPKKRGKKENCLYHFYIYLTFWPLIWDTHTYTKKKKMCKCEGPISLPKSLCIVPL